MISIVQAGSLYIADNLNHLIRKIDALQIYINTDTYSSPSGLITLPGASTYTRMDSDAGGTINNASFALTFGKTDGSTISSTFRGIIQGTGSLTINADPGKSLTLAGPSTYSGGTTVTSGILTLAHNRGAGTNTITYNGGSLQIGANAVNIGNAISLKSSASNGLNLNGFNATLSGAIGGGNGSSTLAVTNSGGAVRTLTLSGANTYTGTTSIGANVTVALSGSSTLGTAGFSFTDNTSTFDISATTSGATVTNLQSGVGNIALGAKRVTLNNTSNISFGGTISDGGLGGSVTKVGTSTLTLTGTNTYTSGTRLQAGTININNIHALGTGAVNFAIAGATLQIGAALTGAIPNDIVLTADGNLDTQGYDVNLGGAVSGSATLHKLGSGILTLSGANTYNGAILQDGIVALGHNQGFGSGTFAFNNPGTQLRIAATLTNVANPVSLATDGAIDTGVNDANFSGAFSGPGGLTKSGVGILQLSNLTNTYAGPTLVNAGELKVNGALSNSAVTVANGAKFTGNASIPTLINLGAVKPGNSIGVINIAGNFSNAGGVYNCKIDATPTSDIINVGGTATLGGTLNILPQPGNYNTPKTYTILTAVNPIATTFDSVTSPSILLKYTLNYLPSMVQLTANQGTSLSSVVTQGNAGTIAQHIDTIAPGAGSNLSDLLNVFPTLFISDLYNSLNQLHPAANTLISSAVAANELSEMDGMFTSLLNEQRLHKISKRSNVDEIHSAQFNFAVAQANMPVAKDRLSSLFFIKTSTFTDPYSPLPPPQAAPQNMRASFGSVNIWFQQATSNINHRSVRDRSITIGVPGVKANLNSTSLGADTQITDQLLLGTTVGHTKTFYKLRQKYGSGRISSYRLALYGMWTPKKKWYVNASGFYGRHRFKGKRNLALSASTYRNRQRHQRHHYSGIIEVGRDIALSNQTTLTPYGSVGGVSLKENGYAETADGLKPGLKVKGRISCFIQAKVGLQLSSLYKLNDIQLYVYAKLGYIYKNPLRKPQRVTATFIGYDGNFTVFANTKQQNMFNPGLGITALLTDQLSLTASYTGEISPVQRLHQALIRLDYNF